MRLSCSLWSTQLRHCDLPWWLDRLFQLLQLPQRLLRCLAAREPLGQRSGRPGGRESFHFLREEPVADGWDEQEEEEDARGAKEEEEEEEGRDMGEEEVENTGQGAKRFGVGLTRN